jgi:hypothetical protein
MKEGRKEERGRRKRENGKKRRECAGWCPGFYSVLIRKKGNYDSCVHLNKPTDYFKGWSHETVRCSKL